MFGVNTFDEDYGHEAAAAFVVTAELPIFPERFFTRAELDADPESSWLPEGCWCIDRADERLKDFRGNNRWLWVQSCLYSALVTGPPVTIECIPPSTFPPVVGYRTIKIFRPLFGAFVSGHLCIELGCIHRLRGFEHHIVLAQHFVEPGHSRFFRNPYCRNVAFAVASVSLLVPITRTSFPWSPANFRAFPNSMYS
jgi:hypothetical protein